MGLLRDYEPSDGTFSSTNTHCHGNLVTEGGGGPLDGRCYSVGPPVYSWDQILIGGLSNIPDIEASSL